MDLKSWVLDNTWLADPERACAVKLAHEFEKMFDQFEVVRTPLLVLHAEHAILSYLIVRRVEARLNDGLEMEHDPPKRPLDPVLDAVGKARERWRKAMKELEEYCAKAGTPIDRGLADIMKPILKKAEGVYEDAVEFEARKKKAKK